MIVRMSVVLNRIVANTSHLQKQGKLTTHFDSIDDHRIQSYTHPYSTHIIPLIFNLLSEMTPGLGSEQSQLRNTTPCGNTFYVNETKVFIKVKIVSF